MDERYYDGPEWTKLRRQCLQFYKNRCYRCSRHFPYGHGLQAHHIIPRDAGGADTPVNLIPLCNGPGTLNCHDYVEVEGIHSLVKIRRSFLGKKQIERRANLGLGRKKPKRKRTPNPKRLKTAQPKRVTYEKSKTPESYCQECGKPGRHTNRLCNKCKRRWPDYFEHFKDVIGVDPGQPRERCYGLTYNPYEA